MNDSTSTNPGTRVRRGWIDKLLPAFVVLSLLSTVTFIVLFRHEVWDEFRRIVLVGGSYLAVTGIIMIGVYVPWLNRRTAHDDAEQIEEIGSAALGVQRGALILGFGLGVAGGLFSPAAGSFGEHLLYCTINGLLVTLVMVLGTKSTDAFLLRRIDNMTALLGGYMSVAWAEAGCYIGRGIILFAAFAGADRSPFEGFLNVLLFAVLGEATFALAYLVLDLLIPTDYEAEIAGGNVGAGIEVGGFLISLGTVLAASIVGPFTGWGKDVVSYLIAVVPSAAMLVAAIVIVDKFMLRRVQLGTRVHHGKISVSVVAALVMMATAALLSGAVVGPYVKFLG